MKIEFNTDNAAFEQEDLEIVRILDDISKKVYQGFMHGNIKDINGNIVGKWDI